MSWIAILVIVVAAFLALKAVGLVVRLLLWAVVIGAAYWFLAPMLDLPRPW
jgi:hypothetical protein